jgi:hypothetical protein
MSDINFVVDGKFLALHIPYTSAQRMVVLNVFGAWMAGALELPDADPDGRLIAHTMLADADDAWTETTEFMLADANVRMTHMCMNMAPVPPWDFYPEIRDEPDEELLYAFDNVGVRLTLAEVKSSPKWDEAWWKSHLASVHRHFYAFGQHLKSLPKAERAAAVWDMGIYKPVRATVVVEGGRRKITNIFFPPVPDGGSGKPSTATGTPTASTTPPPPAASPSYAAAAVPVVSEARQGVRFASASQCLLSQHAIPEVPAPKKRKKILKPHLASPPLVLPVVTPTTVRLKSSTL